MSDGEWLEAAFGRHRRWGLPTLLEGSLRQRSQTCTGQLPARVEDQNPGSKMLPRKPPANRRERCGVHMPCNEADSHQIARGALAHQASHILPEMGKDSLQAALGYGKEH